MIILISFIKDHLDKIGLVLNFVGSVLLIVSNLFMTKKKALELGASRLCGDTDEENLKLPAVKALLDQKRWAILGTVVFAMGFILQLF